MIRKIIPAEIHYSGFFFSFSYDMIDRLLGQAENCGFGRDDAMLLRSILAKRGGMGRLN
jgi:hypothetical protein